MSILLSGMKNMVKIKSKDGEEMKQDIYDSNTPSIMSVNSALLRRKPAVNGENGSNIIKNAHDDLLRQVSKQSKTSLLSKYEQISEENINSYTPDTIKERLINKHEDQKVRGFDEDDNLSDRIARTISSASE